MAATVLILPGLGNSGPEHWQSWLQGRHPSFRRVEQADWDAPVLADWVETLERAVAASSAPVVLIAHSLSCILVAHWAARGAETGSADKIAAALLVAPPDVESPALTPPEVHGFGPVPTDPLPFRTVVLASRTDPYCSVGRACGFAVGWGADFIEAGDLGHINTESGHGPWPDGERLVLDLLKDIEP
ncbi:RBBP9/YdeN family alpha/beta hydrolase [Azospirillum rugosum]|uniref:Alpha/beta hydrolase family esterase n=1 Tax=Azospirillum rugosum TaxID=416170 RepID=A0ABS4SGL3_9PROT|nr:alpha/beta hydrolase [Azospirillum rugosum]MBP2291706.1 putative alpha/beta hydrolase family esterase [Azospirillum rugosum]MDQ0524482.1 putative alpha/beta hydrolase family esterase [Azospirillum rugosum]